MHKVSVIIPTFNRFIYLLNAIESVKSQTYRNIEIIVINDKSTQKEYYEYNFDNDVTIIHLQENSKKKFGFACAGYVRNQGIKVSAGEYIAFLDDDDIWFPDKLTLQMNAIKKSTCDMSCTDGLFGYGMYDKTKQYEKYNAEHYFYTLKNIYKKHNSNLLDNGFPDIWNDEFIKIHNCCITSSVVIKKAILEKINYMKFLENGKEDRDCWLRTLQHTNCVYVKDVCFYYDARHGDGQNYGKTKFRIFPFGKFLWFLRKH